MSFEAHASARVVPPGEWVETEGGRVRLVLGSARVDGTVRGVIEIDLEPGWKTYWIAPGPGGIPPQFETWRSENLTLDRIEYPAPVSFADAYGTSVGYDADVAFPLTFRIDNPQQASRLSMTGLLGICEDICIPVQFAIEGPVRQGMSTPMEDGRRIRAAFGALPEPGDPSVIVARGFEDRIVLTGAPVEAENNEVFVAQDSASFGKPERTDESLNVPILGGAVDGDVTVVVRSPETETQYSVSVN